MILLQSAAIERKGKMNTDFYDIENMAIVDAFAKADLVLRRHKKVSVSISGGSDSDIVMDMIERTKTNQDVQYVWFDTGIEYQATKDHLKYLEQKYGVHIHKEKAIKPIPTCVREYGVPFLSKYASEMISRLQKNNFTFEDKPFEKLKIKYPKCISALKWWCNCQDGKIIENKVGKFNISRNKWLKEFMIANPPDFRIDNKCCLYAKKKVAKGFVKRNDADLNVIGVRRAEGGIRAAAYESCFTERACGMDDYRPIFWFTDEDKRFYENQFGVRHSDCYRKYGLKRTGCVGCPYGRNVEDELNSIKMFEPKLYKACMKIFGKSYEYTRKYRQFCLEMNKKENANPDQLSMDDMFYDFNASR